MILKSHIYSLNYNGDCNHTRISLLQLIHCNLLNRMRKSIFGMSGVAPPGQVNIGQVSHCRCTFRMLLLLQLRQEHLYLQGKWLLALFSFD